MSELTITTSAGETFGAYAAFPDAGGPAPGLLLLNEVFGVNRFMRAIADYWAGRGFLAVCPKLYCGSILNSSSIRKPPGTGTGRWRRVRISMSISRSRIRRRRLRGSGKCPNAAAGSQRRAIALAGCWHSSMPRARGGLRHLLLRRRHRGPSGRGGADHAARHAAYRRGGPLDARAGPRCHRSGAGRPRRRPNSIHIRNRPCFRARRRRDQAGP